MIIRILIGATLVLALIAGLGLYYLQTYAYYVDVPAAEADVRLVSAASGLAEPVAIEAFRGIDADSSPLRYRACFEVAETRDALIATYRTVEDAVPRVGPGWFDCFDAVRIGADLESGAATGFLGQQNVQYGIDRIVAVYDDGRAYAWHQINACGEVVFDGNPVPDDCPTPPIGLR